MRNVIHWFLSQRFAIVGTALTLFVVGLESLLLWIRGPQADDMHGLLGQLVIWIASQFTAAPTLSRAGSDRSDLIYSLFFYSYTLLSIGFAALLWLCTRHVNLLLTDRPVSFKAVVLLLLQLSVGLCVNSAFLYLIAIELAFIFPPRKALLWLVAQILLYAGIAVWSASIVIGTDANMKIFLLYLGGELFLQIMVFAASYLSILERRGRLQLAKANAELLATQSLLTETVRVSERMRIARDLHDVVGHHLTALNLHLNLALRQTEKARLDTLNLSTELAGSLLAEVRDIVGKERNDQDIDLRHALESLCAGIPQPDINLSFPETLKLHTPASAHTLFCCIQEAISNAMRHSLASKMSIDIRSTDVEKNGFNQKWIQVLIQDNGIGCKQLKEGNGLQGMRERIAELGGSILAMNHPEAGFMLTISIPNERKLA